MLINAFFFGLILMTVPIIAREVKRWDAGSLVLLVLSSMGTYYS